MIIAQEIILLDPMFEIPGSDIRSVEIDESVVMGLRAAKYVRTGDENPSESYESSSEPVSRAVNN